MKIAETFQLSAWPDAAAKLLLVWLGTLFSRESLSYVMLLLTISYTLLLFITLIKKEWWPKRKMDVTPPPFTKE